MLIDYYGILGISPNAQLSDVKKAYRAKAIVSHPDHGGNHEAMLHINEAYEILSNPELRRNYDEARLHQADQQARDRAQRDANKAKQDAEQYPRHWTDFDAWLARDFTEAEYGQWGWFPAVGKSGSGVLFIFIGLGVGCVVAYFLGQQQDMSGRSLLFIPVAGGFIGQWIHKQIGKCIKNQNPPTNKTPGASAPTNPQAAEVEAHDKGVGMAILFGIVALIILVCVCRTTLGDGIFSDEESFINWPGVALGTCASAFVGYWIGKSKTK
jgi:hypothetical protein